MNQRELCLNGQCVDCTTYEDRIATICQDAITYFDNRHSLQTLVDPQKPELIVFDIDGTSLDDRVKGRKKGGDLKRHEPVYLLYRHVVNLGYRIVFLTGRLDGSNQQTIKNLNDEGYDSISDLILCPQEISRTSDAVAVWKDLMRNSLKQRFTLIAVIGDQPMDTEGNHIGEYQIRLPEPPIHQQGCSIM